MSDPIALPAKPDATPPPPLAVVVATDSQPPIPMMQIAPDGVTPVPIAGMSNAENTPAGADGPVGQATPVPQAPPAPAAATGTPVNMTVMAPPPHVQTVVKGEGTTLVPTTTEADDLVTQGQRDINKIWEECQRLIALGVTFATVSIIGAVVVIAMITGREIAQATATQINYLVVMTTLILSFYFSRTNHAAIGGVGAKPNEPYTGR